MTDPIDGPAGLAGQGQSCPEPTTAAIRDLNDRFRQTFQGGLVVMTPSVEGLGVATIRRACILVKNFAAFTPDNDPHGEHDFGSFALDGERFFWEIDCYDPTLSTGSTDPANPKLTRRVLTLMLSDEY